MYRKANIEEKVNELYPQVLGITGTTSFPGNVSSSRQCMHSNHDSSHVVLINSEKKQSVIAGGEYELGKIMDDIRIDNDCIVKSTVHKLDPSTGVNPETALFTTFEKDGELYLDLIKIPCYKSKNNYFGYPLIPTEDFNNIGYNTPLKAGTILATSTSYNEDGFYKTGVNANVAFLPVPGTAEDGYVVSRSFLNKLLFTSISKRVIYLDRNKIPINLHGDDEYFKFLPEIGEEVDINNLVAAIRERDDYLSVVDLNNDDIKEVDFNFDEEINVTRNSKVIDIKITRGANIRQVYSDNMCEQLEKYYGIEQNYQAGIVSRFNSIVNELKQGWETPPVINYTPRCLAAVTEAMIFNETATNKRKLMYNKMEIDLYRIEVTCMAVVKPNRAFKLTGLAADMKR